MENTLRAISITHVSARVEIREKLSLSISETNEFYLKLREVFGIEESLILTTCNRLELYYFSETDLSESLIRYWCSFKALDASNVGSYFFKYDKLAIDHLYKVSMGLKSQILGDIQIFGQVKQAYQMSVDAGCSGTLMNRLMHKIFFCHKAVNQETSFKDGAASVSYNAVDILRKDQLGSADSRVLVIGAGQMGSDICRHLSKKGYSDVSITNRTLSKAQLLADECRFRVIPFSEHVSVLKSYDIIFSTVSCSSVVYESIHFTNADLSAVIDVSSPRSVSSSITRKGIALYNIDDISQTVDQVIRRREDEVPKVEAIIQDSIEDYMKWTEDLVFSDQVKKFKATLEVLRQQTMASMLKKMDENQKELADEVTQKMLQKIINLPVLNLKTACKRGQVEELSESLNELFNTEYKNQVKS